MQVILDSNLIDTACHLIMTGIHKDLHHLDAQKFCHHLKQSCKPFTDMPSQEPVNYPQSSIVEGDTLPVPEKE